MKLRLIALLTLSTIALSSAFADTLWIDVRSEAEYQRDHIDGHPLVPHTQIDQLIDRYTENKDDTIYLYCAAGIRAEMARKLLLKRGYENVVNVGGINDARQMISEQGR